MLTDHWHRMKQTTQSCQYFYEYVYGQCFIVYNSHKPLKPIMNEQVTKAQPRIRCFFLRIQKYDFDLEYTKGKLMQVAGHTILGRITNNTPGISNKEINYFVHFMMLLLLISEKSLQKLVTKVAKDDTLKEL